MEIRDKEDQEKMAMHLGIVRQSAFSEKMSGLRRDCTAVRGEDLSLLCQTSLTGAPAVLQEMRKRNFGHAGRVLPGLYAPEKDI